MKLGLSSPLRDLKPHYDVVIVGSGYGGGVAAARLAGKGRSICVLERGREFMPGEFPDRISTLAGEIQVTSSAGHAGRRLGLFDVRLGKDVHVAVGCGLGGTSLINANVCLEPDPRVLQDPVWPAQISNDGELARGYASAREMLRPVPYPGLRKLLKLGQLEGSARSLSTSLQLPPLHVTFEQAKNAAGVEQQACTLCGDCCAGCNVGAKTTTATTYLSFAHRRGAEVFTCVQVRSLAKSKDGAWQVNAVVHDGLGWETRLSLTAGIVVLAAGTLGSTEILLRSRNEGLPLSDRLGERFSVNGDSLAIAYDNTNPVNGVGVGHPPKVHTEPVGPAVAGLVDLRNTNNLDDGLVLVEASPPSGSAAAIPLIYALDNALPPSVSSGSLSDQIDAAGRALRPLAEGAYSGHIRHAQTFLAAGHDRAGGRVRLERDVAVIDWPDIAQDPVFERVAQLFAKAASATGGSYIKNPLSTRLMGGKPLTVHPLGGCAVAADRQSGVVNHKSQVFDSAPQGEPTAIHAGLYICDGSIMPRSLGVHPLLTITALAERAMVHLLRDRGWK